MRIRTLLITMLVSAMTLVGVLFSALWLVHDRLDTLSDVQTSSQSVLREASELLVLTNEYALRGSERVSDQWRIRQQRLLGLLHPTKGADPATIAELSDQVDSLGSFFDRLVDAKAGGDTPFQRLRAGMLIDQLLLRTQALFDQADRWSTSARATERQLADWFHRMVVTLPVIVIVLLAVLSWLISRRVLRPLSRLNEAVLAVAQGDLSVRTATTLSDEIGEVSQTFDALALDMVSQLRQEVAVRRQAEAEMKVQSARLQAILDAEPECVLLLGPNFELLDINKTGLAWIEVASVEEAKKVGLRTLIDPAYRKDVLALFRNAALGKVASIEFRLCGVRGGERWVQSYVAPLTDAQGRSEILSVSRDITVNKQLTMELERQAHIDFLTQLNNRGRFMQLAEAELSRANRYGAHVSVLMLDVDHFKKVNDTHGHKVGDQALVKLGEVCQKTLRSFDIIGRMGGEEFAVLLPQTDQQEAVEVAERLRIAIGDTPVSLAQGLPLHFSVSIGVSTRLSPEDNLDMLLSRADDALYAAKTAGRDRVAVTDASENLAQPDMKVVR